MPDRARAMRRRAQILLSFFLPMLLLAGVYAARGVEPFGANTLLFGDMGGQYLNFMASYKELFGRGLFYTWHKALGGEALSLNAYYLFSPFNLLLLLFPAAKLSLAVVCITLLKTGAAGLTMGLFLRSLGSRGPVALALAAAYALSGYMAGFAQNLMWLDGVILAPLAVWGLRRLLSGGRPWLYLAALFAALLTCYYIGWMLCFYSALYFLLHWLALGRAPHRLRIAGRFCAASALAGGLAAWVLLPCALALGQGKASFAMEWGFAANFEPFALVRQFFAGAYTAGEVTNQLPLIFCGLLPLALALAFFLRKGPSAGEKLAGAGLLAVLLAFWLTGRAHHGDGELRELGGDLLDLLGGLRLDGRLGHHQDDDLPHALDVDERAEQTRQLALLGQRGHVVVGGKQAAAFATAAGGNVGGDDYDGIHALPSSGDRQPRRFTRQDAPHDGARRLAGDETHRLRRWGASPGGRRRPSSSATPNCNDFATPAPLSHRKNRGGSSGRSRRNGPVDAEDARARERIPCPARHPPTSDAPGAGGYRSTAASAPGASPRRSA